MEEFTEALAKQEIRYKFTASLIPSRDDGAFRVVFSRPTYECPESPLFVTLDLRVAAREDGVVRYLGYAEGMHWPLTFTVGDGELETFPQFYIDKIWLQKKHAGELALWEEDPAGAGGGDSDSNDDRH